VWRMWREEGWWLWMVYLNKEFYQLASSPEMCKKNVALPFVNRNNVARSPAMWHGHEWCSKLIYLPNRDRSSLVPASRCSGRGQGSARAWVRG
jgi:hypothetical protein